MSSLCVFCVWVCNYFCVFIYYLEFILNFYKIFSRHKTKLFLQSN